MSCAAHLVAQIIHGQRITLPRPGAQACTRLIDHGRQVGSELRRGQQRPRGLDEPELHLGSDILVSDLAGWQRERMPALPEKAYFDLAPNWVCEVLSPATAQMDRVDKLPLYAAQAVGHAWLVDPDAQTLEVYALHERRWRLECAFKAEEISAPPFEALRFSLAALWP